MSEWISVKDRLPMYEDRVLLCVLHRPIETRSFLRVTEGALKYTDKNGNFFQAADPEHSAYVPAKPYSDTVTHWMPLPEPPEADNGQDA